MKLLILGAAGETGSRLAIAASQNGHQVTTFARNRDKLAARLGDHRNGISVAIGDAMDETALAVAMAGQDVVINAAGNAWDGASFAPLVQTALRAANAALGAGGRFWFFGGAGVLDIPGTNLMGLDLPGIPALYRAHRANLEAARQTQLDWSMLCPGPMIASPSGRAHEGLRLSVDTWPFAAPPFARMLPRVMLTLAFASRRSEITITYEDAVKVILDNLGCNGPFSRRRVGIALPEGVRLSKPGGGAKAA